MGATPADVSVTSSAFERKLWAQFSMWAAALKAFLNTVLDLNIVAI